MTSLTLHHLNETYFASKDGMGGNEELRLSLFLVLSQSAESARTGLCELVKPRLDLHSHLLPL